MRVIDISQRLHAETPVYPGDPRYASTLVSSFGRGDDYEVSRLSFGSHIGTHIDAPSHMIQGAASIDAVPLDRCVGPCRIVTLCHGMIKKQMLEHVKIVPGERLLIRTDPAGELLDAGQMNDAAIDLEAAEYLARLGICLLGIDSPSIENMERTRGRVHRVLLHAGIVILEGLDLRHAAEERGFLCALPLKLQGENGSPCRAALLYE